MRSKSLTVALFVAALVSIGTAASMFHGMSVFEPARESTAGGMGVFGAMHLRGAVQYWGENPSATDTIVPGEVVGFDPTVITVVTAYNIGNVYDTATIANAITTTLDTLVYVSRAYGENVPSYDTSRLGQYYLRLYWACPTAAVADTRYVNIHGYDNLGQPQWIRWQKVGATTSYDTILVRFPMAQVDTVYVRGRKAGDTVALYAQSIFGVKVNTGLGTAADSEAYAGVAQSYIYPRRRGPVARTGLALVKVDASTNDIRNGYWLSPTGVSGYAIASATIPLMPIGRVVSYNQANGTVLAMLSEPFTTLGAGFDSLDGLITSSDSIATIARDTANQALADAATAQDTANQALADAAIARDTANQALADAATAQDTANQALSDAAAAQADADTGRAKGDSGISIGTQARDTANQALADAATAQDTANQALTDAATAQDTANQALTDAATAQDTANQALADAATAQDTANQALADASTAQDTANQALADAATAQDTANTALTDASTAQDTANQALADAATAQDTANQALADAATAQDTANQALADAATAQDTANQALADAATAQDTANQALADAATAQDTANAGLAKGDSALTQIQQSWFQEFRPGQLVIPAASGPALTQTDGTNVSYFTAGYDKDADEWGFSEFSFPSFALGLAHDSLRVEVWWLGDTVALDTVVWQLKFIPRATGTAFDTTMGYGGWWKSANQGNGKVNYTNSVFVSPTPGIADIVSAGIGRDADNGSDGYAKDALLLLVRYSLYR